MSRSVLCFALLVGVVSASHLGVRLGNYGRPDGKGCRLNDDLARRVCPVWNYQALNWGEQCAAWSTCSSGKGQSPIDISNFALQRNSGTPLSLDVMYSPSRVTIFNTGQYLTIPVSEYTGLFTWKGSVFTLKQVNFQTPSEHSLYGVRYPMELQFLHEDEKGKKANIAVLVTEGAKNDAFSRFFDYLPKQSMCSCGNGIIEPWMGEVCDEGKNNSDTVRNACRMDCKWARCGDGIVDSGEECDFGTSNSSTRPNFCRPDCRLPFCGDGVVDTNNMVLDLRNLDQNLVPIPVKMGFEKCDDGNNRNGDGCDEFCRFECGNGIVEGGEACDLGEQNGNFSFSKCRPDCTLPRCGDGVLNAAEECDQAQVLLLPDMCRPNCLLPRCGDNITDEWLGEECDGRIGCDSDCRLLCGNSRVDPPEECDEGANNDDSGSGTCRTNCLRPRCGDGIVDQAVVHSLQPRREECDDGDLNGEPGGRCTFNCSIACGNGIQERGEECDDPTGNSNTLPNKCRVRCRNPSCGDGVQDNGEECDIPNSPLCRNCKTPVCGDGFIDTYRGEECDDGNFVAGDGCSPTCLKECGNGIKDSASNLEQCDNGALNSNVRPDSCRANCRLPICGDGVTDSNEECDDALANSDTRPNACRTNCRLPYCGDSIVDNGFGEICDKGTSTQSPNSNIVVDGCSERCTPNRCAQSVTDSVINFQDLVPCPAIGFYQYTGSLTKPPCTEAVEWFVSEKFITLSTDQLQHITSILNNTARPTQPLNFRYVRYPTDNPAVCGNGIKETGEECDDPRGNSDTVPNSCRTKCKLPSCGDGVTDCSEECDGGMTCTSDCRRGMEAKGNRTVVNVFFKDLLPYNHFCCSAAKPSPKRAPCSSC